ncbi:hypothetical protein FB2170_04640 [Maribacter sp. HTCC2170]|nr:hypothetical protein FB2170_04640 [Maribacter sp. HTCC2170]
MATLQEILVYLIVFMAFGFILKKFFLPKSLFSTKKESKKICGQEDCGCH